MERSWNSTPAASMLGEIKINGGLLMRGDFTRGLVQSPRSKGQSLGGLPSRCNRVQPGLTGFEGQRLAFARNGEKRAQKGTKETKERDRADGAACLPWIGVTRISNCVGRVLSSICPFFPPLSLVIARVSNWARRTECEGRGGGKFPGMKAE